MLISKKKTDFNNKLKDSNKKVTSNRTKHVLVEDELNKLSKNVEVISAKGLKEALIDKYSIFNGAKSFSNLLQNYLVFISANKYVEFSVRFDKFIHRNLKEHQKKVLKILLDQTILLLQV